MAGCNKEVLEAPAWRIHAETYVQYTLNGSYTPINSRKVFYYDLANRLSGTGPETEPTINYLYYGDDSLFFDGGYAYFATYYLNDEGLPYLRKYLSAGYNVYYTDTCNYYYEGNLLKEKVCRGGLFYSEESYNDSIYNETTYFIYDNNGNLLMDSTIYNPTGEFIEKNIYSYYTEMPDLFGINSLRDRPHVPMFWKFSNLLLKSVERTVIVFGEPVYSETEYEYSLFESGFPGTIIRTLTISTGDVYEYEYRYEWETVESS